MEVEKAIAKYRNSISVKQNELNSYLMVLDYAMPKWQKTEISVLQQMIAKYEKRIAELEAGDELTESEMK